MKTGFEISKKKFQYIVSLMNDNCKIITEDWDNNVVDYFLENLKAAGENDLNTYFTDDQIEKFQNLTNKEQSEIYDDLIDWIKSELEVFNNI